MLQHDSHFGSIHFLQVAVLANYFTLKSVVREINLWLGEQEPILVESIVSFRKDELRILLGNGVSLVAILQPIQGALFLSRSSERLPKQNVHTAFPELTGSQLLSVEMASNDRLVTLHFGDYALGLNFYGSPNAALTTSGTVVSYFKKHTSTDANVVSEKPSNQLALLGKRLTKEFEVREASTEVEHFFKLLDAGVGGWIYREGGKLLLSPVELRSSDASKPPEYWESISEAVRYTLTNRHRSTGFDERRRTLVTTVGHLLKRVTTVLAEIDRAKLNASRSEELQSIGSAVLGAAYLIERNQTEISIALDGVERKIKLDAKLSPFQNAERSFERARRARKSAIELEQRAKRLTRERTQLELLGEQARLAADRDALEHAEAALKLIVGDSSLDETRARSAESDPLARFRQYSVAGGLRLLVGKSATQNDELTLHVAKKEDIWFHARGVKGSHAVLQTASAKKGIVPKEAIEQAAQIAAYFSDAKTQSVAPVSYTKKKYVRKAKGGAPGAVILEREEVIIVRPEIPSTAKSNLEKDTH